VQQFYDPDGDLTVERHTAAAPSSEPQPSNLNERSYLVLMVTAATGASSISIILSIVLLICFNGITKGLMAAYVIDNQGNRLRINQIDDPKQQQKHIQDYATWVTRSLCTYRWYLPTDDGGKKPDPGFLVGSTAGGSGKKVPTAVYLGSLNLEPHFAAEYLQIVADQLVKADMPASSRVVSEFVPQKASIPESIGSSKWKVRVTGTQINRAESGSHKLISVVKELTVREVPAVSQTFAEKSYREKGLAEGLAEARSWGLETIYITDLIKSKPTGVANDKPRS
jgi:hypothetical protein